MNLDSKIINYELSQIADIVKQYQIIIIDEQIVKLYPWLENTLKQSQIKFIKIMSNAEENKNINFFAQVIEQALSHNITRHDRLLGIGGGACLDFAGMLAMCLLRGLEHSFIPTTVLAMIDACYGGKVGLNSKHGKNLIGGFHAPSSIYMISEFRNTLPQVQLASGHGELLKYAFMDSKIKQALVNNDDINTIYRMALEFKKKICMLDPFEKNERKVLNLGHSFGHAIELSLGLPHGISVMFGIEIMMKLLNKKNDIEVFNQFILKLNLWDSYQKYYLQVKESLNLDQLWGFLLKDKKNTDSIELVYVESDTLKLYKYELFQLRRLVYNSYVS
jgi:3-dehydroquinate synthase